MIQELIVWTLFVVAAAYLLRLLYNSFKPTSAGCAKGCASCSALDIKKIEKQIRKSQP